jgi:hypothetical protein
VSVSVVVIVIGIYGRLKGPITLAKAITIKAGTARFSSFSSVLVARGSLLLS